VNLVWQSWMLSVINWTVVGQLSWQYLATVDRYSQWCIGGGVYGVPPYTNLQVFWQRILTSVIINKQGTFRPFSTALCVYPPPFLAIHHWLQFYRSDRQLLSSPQHDSVVLVNSSATAADTCWVKQCNFDQMHEICISFHNHKVQWQHFRGVLSGFNTCVVFYGY